MPTQTRKVHPAAHAAALLLCLSVVSCVSTLLGPPLPSAPPTAFRVENATASAVEVVIQVLDVNGEPVELDASTPFVDIPVVTVTTEEVSFSTLTPIGAAAAAQAQQSGAGDGVSDGLSDLGAWTTVHMPGFAITEGYLVCGPIVQVSATLQDTETVVLFEGEGTGTPGFDAGSVGEFGERFLLEGVHFACGQSVVIRIGEDGSATNGKLAVVPAGGISPFDPIESPDTGTGEGGEDGGDSEEPSSTDIQVQIENRATIIADVHMVVGTTAGEQSFDVSVPPDAATEGEFACGTQLTFSAVFPNTERPPNQEDNSLFPDAIIVLTGDGTGAPGFDEASVSPDGERFLVVGTHVNCGDTVVLTILDDSAVLTPNGFNGVGVGAASLQVGSESGEAGDTQDPEGSASEPDMSLVIDNQTGEFVRVDAVGGAASLGQQLDIFVTAGGQSEGALSCADRYTLTAYSLIPSALQGLLDQVLVILQGDGTGTTGFDEGSIGSIGQRLLLRGIHYECGGTLEVTITDPGQLGFAEPSIVDTNGVVIGFDDINSNGIQDEVPDRLGEGTVEVE